jgi:hypothetical protein
MFCQPREDGALHQLNHHDDLQSGELSDESVTDEVGLEVPVSAQDGEHTNGGLDTVEDIEDNECGTLMLACRAHTSDDDPGNDSREEAAGQEYEDESTLLLKGSQ